MLEKPSILVLVTTLKCGGCEKNVYEFVTRIDPARYDVCVVSVLGADGYYGALLSDAGVSVEYLAMRGWWDISVFHKLGAIIKRRKVQIIHSFLFHANIIARITAKIFRVPVNIASIRTMEQGTPWHLAVDRLTKRAVSYELTNSERVREFTIAKTGSNAARIQTIYNGVTVPEDVDSSVRGELRKRFGIEPDSIVIGAVGSLEFVKDHALLVSVAAELCHTDERIQFVIIGEGSERDALTQLIKQYGLTGKCLLLGFHAKAQALMPLFDVCVLTSRWEGFPNVLLEAMSVKVPVVACDVGGVCELVKDSQTGALVTKRTAQAYARRIEEFINDKEQTSRCIDEAYAMINEKFTIERMVEETTQVYDMLYQNIGRDA